MTFIFIPERDLIYPQSALDFIFGETMTTIDPRTNSKVDRELRQVCIELAVKNGVGRMADATRIVADAKLIEQYIRGSSNDEPTMAERLAAAGADAVKRGAGG